MCVFTICALRLQNLRSQDVGPNVTATDYISGAGNTPMRHYAHSGENMSPGTAQRIPA